MNLVTERYVKQQRYWPARGCHVLAQYDDNSIIVYQAYRRSIGTFAVKHQQFGGEFSLDRMSWIKPNFLWMMYRCGWGTKPDQEMVLAVRLRRAAFDEILRCAVHSSFEPRVYARRDDWKAAVAESDVRLQWDPDHDPMGKPLARRAIQLGLRGAALVKYAGEWLLEILDATEFVLEQRKVALAGEWERLHAPRERVYPVPTHSQARLGITS